MKEHVALYPGSFDAATNGHLDIIQRAAAGFDRVVVAVAVNREKSPLFTIEERMDILKEMTRDLPNVEVTSFEGLTVDFAHEIGARFIIRGLRAVSDFEYELQLALMNRQLHEEIETIFMVPSVSYSFISSSLVKTVAKMGGNLSEFVPPAVERHLLEKFGVKGGASCDRK